MKITIVFILLIAACLAQQQEQQEQEPQETEEEIAAQSRPSRAPQGHLQYSDPDGLKVSWKLFSPYTQWRSSLENNAQRNERAESGTSQAAYGSHQANLIRPAGPNDADATEEKAVVQPVRQVQVQYKPYSMVPTHIKQLIFEMYQPRGPYVDPSVYIYPNQQEQPEEQQKQASEESAQTAAQTQYNSQLPTFEHIPKFQTKYPLNKAKYGYAQYSNEASSTASSVPRYGSVPERRESAANDEQREEQSYDDGMPKEIHQLLNLQAQIPYHNIANRIYYKPKSLFIPKPLGDAKGPYKYRSKIYYIKNGDEELRSKERVEREEPKVQETDAAEEEEVEDKSAEE